MNICIVGLNQIFDVPIDRINKPYLPLASGELSMRMGKSLVSRLQWCSRRGLLLQFPCNVALVVAC